MHRVLAPGRIVLVQYGRGSAITNLVCWFCIVWWSVLLHSMNNSQYHTIHSVPYHTIQLLLYETSVTRFFVSHSANGIFVYVPNFLRPLLIAPFVDHIHSFRSLFNPSVVVLHLFTAPFRYRHCYAYNRIVDSITSCLLVSWLIERHHMSFDVRITVVCLCMCFYSSPGCIALSCRIIWEYGSHDFFFCTTLPLLMIAYSFHC